MPEWVTHNDILDLFSTIFGIKKLSEKEKNEVNKLLDWPAMFLGPKHRNLFHDTALTPFMVLLLKGPKAAWAAFIHIITDKSFSALPKEVQQNLKTLLELYKINQGIK